MRTILAVDDDSQNLYLLEALLAGNGYQVITAPNGAEALTKARLRPPDLVVADILMPVMDGFQFCREWKRDDRLKDIPFVIYTATYTDPKDERFALALGADRFIVKPQEPEAILAILGEVMAAHEAGRLATSQASMPDETIYYQRYNEALIRKLEQKMVQVEQAKESLEREVAQHLRTLDELRLAHQRLRCFVDANIIGIVIATADGDVIEANDYYLDIIGCTRDDLAAGRINWRSLTPSEALPADQRALREMRERGSSLPYEKEYLLPDGTRVPILLATALLPGPEEQIAAFVLDVTERKRQEAERIRLSAAIEQAAEIVIVTDPDGTIQYVNPAFIAVTGYEREEAIGQNPRILRSGHQDQEFYRKLWATITSGASWSGRIVNRRKNGELYTEEATISPVVDSSGRIINYVAVKRDITEHLKLAEQFQQAQKMESIGRLAGGVAHDFNNALTPVVAISGMLLKGLSPQHPMYQDVKDINKAGERCAALTRQLLAFSRQQPLRPDVLNLNDVVKDITRMLCRVLGANVEVMTSLDPQLPQVKADIGQMEQVIVNLALNARDAMPEGGTLSLQTTSVTLGAEHAECLAGAAPGRYVLLAVSDTGTGMDESTKAQVFEPFFTTKERGKGTGLGLSTVYGIAKQSGGGIWVNSEPGVGSTFNLYLPVIEGSEGPAEEQKPSTELARGSETLLLVEDDDEVRAVSARVLRSCGYEVLEARGGGEALEIAAAYREPIRLLVTDIVMPGMSGKETAERLLESRPGTRVLFTSGYAAGAAAHQGVLSSGTQHLQKPFTAESLAGAVRRVLDGA